MQTFSATLVVGFNSKLVRLEVRMRCLLLMVRICFNSKLVRLEVPML